MYYLIVYQPNRYDCPHNMQQMRVNKKNGSVAFFGLDTRAEKVMYESDIYDGQTYISDARQREYYSVDDDLYCGCSEGLLKISLDTMKYEKIELQAQNKYDSWKISGCGNKIGYNRCIIIFISPSLCFYNNIIISTSFRWKIYSITIFFKQFHSVYILIIKKVIKNTPCFFHGHLRYF